MIDSVPHVDETYPSFRAIEIASLAIRGRGSNVSSSAAKGNKGKDCESSPFALLLRRKRSARSQASSVPSLHNEVSRGVEGREDSTIEASPFEAKENKLKKEKVGYGL